MCVELFETRTLFRPKFVIFPILFPTRSEMRCPISNLTFLKTCTIHIKHANSRPDCTNHTLLQTKMADFLNSISDQNGSKAIPFGSSDTLITYITEYTHSLSREGNRVRYFIMPLLICGLSECCHRCSFCLTKYSI